MDLVGAWLDGRLDLGQLVESYESGRIDLLALELERARVPRLAAAIDSAVTARTPDVRPRTLARYREGFAHLRSFFGESARLSDVLTDDGVQGFKAHRLGRVKPGTVNKDLQALSVLVTHAKSRGWIQARPTIKKFGVAPKTIPMGGAELAVYLAELRPPFRPLMAFLLATGCRLGEAEALTVSDLRHLDDGSYWATIRAAKTTAGVRSVPVPRETARQLEARIDDVGLVGTDRLFQVIPRRTVQKEHERAVRAAGIRNDYTIHRHRDTFGVTMARRGMPIPTLQRILGHRTIQQTMKYAGFQPEYADVDRYINPDQQHQKADLSGTKSGTRAKR